MITSIEPFSRPLVAGVMHNTHPVMTPEAKAKAELWWPDLPLGAIEQVDHLLTWSAGRCCTLLYGTPLILRIYESAIYGFETACERERNPRSRRAGGRLSNYKFINY